MVCRANDQEIVSTFNLKNSVNSKIMSWTNNSKLLILYNEQTRLLQLVDPFKKRVKSVLRLKLNLTSIAFGQNKSKNQCCLIG